MTQASADIISERHRQEHAEGWSLAHDDKHNDGSLVMAAICYAALSQIEIKVLNEVPCGCREASCEHWGGTVKRWIDPWPWEGRPKFKSRRFDLVRAAALLLAEIERIDRAETLSKGQ